MKRELICILCPKGCNLKIVYEGKKITGNDCPKGITFATEEITNPQRIVTTTVKVVGNKNFTRLPVRTREPIAKEKMASLIIKLKKVKITKKIKLGEIILKNIYGTNVIASRSI